MVVSKVRAMTVALIVVSAASAASAAAEPAVPSTREVILDTPRRARRAIALGPTLGVAATFAADADPEVPFGGGFGFALFDVPVVPTAEMVLEVAKARARARLEALVRDGQRPDPEQILQEVRDEVLRELSPRPRVREKPRLFGVAEATYGPVEEAWELRAHLAIGILGVTVGPTLTGHFGAVDGVAAGGELGLLLVPSPRPRASVVNLYLRAEFGVTGDALDTFTLGARYLVDLL